MYALVLAGGQGTRLWPCSRQSRPKQLLNLLGERTLLQQTVDRIKPLVSPERTVVVTNAAYSTQVREQLPEIPADNIISEPEGRNTAPAVALGTMLISQRDPEATVVTLSADHFIQGERGFLDTLLLAAQVAQNGYLVTVGVPPTRPETGYGYIQLGPPLPQFAAGQVHAVARFTEKPDEERAKKFIADGQHLWNAGMFIWRADVVLAAISRHLPQLYSLVGQLAGQRARLPEMLASIWPLVPSISIDVGVLEKADNVAVVRAQFAWSDLGTWTSLAEVLPRDVEGNICIGQEVVRLEMRNCLIHGRRRLIATIGLQDLIVVDTEDALLICHREKAQAVKELVDMLRSSGREQYL